MRQFRGSLNEDGALIKMDMNKQASLLALSCTDKCVYVYELGTYECVGYFCGHSEVITDVKFTADGRHLVTVSVDGCIFIWRLSNLILNPSSVSSTTTCANPSVPQQSLHHLRSSLTNTCHYASNQAAASISSWSKCRANSLSSYNQLILPTSNSNPTNLCDNNEQLINHPASSLMHQQSLDTILDNDLEYLPTWARNKLASTSCSQTQLSQSTNSIATNASCSLSQQSHNASSTLTTMPHNTSNTDQTSNNTRRSRALWGPPVSISTSFAIMDEVTECDQTASLLSNMSGGGGHGGDCEENKKNLLEISSSAEVDTTKQPMATADETSSAALESSQLLNDNDDDDEEEDEEMIDEIIEEVMISGVQQQQQPTTTTITAALPQTLSDEETEKAKTPIQFPSPCIDKDFFHVRPVKLNELDMGIGAGLADLLR